MTNIEVGKKAPDFALVNQDGQEIKLSDYNGQNVLLAFYSFDFSPICTAEFGCFQHDFGELKNLAVRILGVSIDSKYSHKEFANKLNIKFPLLSDFNKEVCRLYGTLRKDGYSERAYFLIDKKGVIRFKKVMPVPKERLENKALFEELKKII